MPQRIEVPGMGIVEFPDGMTDDQIASAIKSNMPETDKRSGVQQFMQNAAAGLVRGAGSIGATFLTPIDKLMGNTQSWGNPERRQAMDDAFRTMGVDTESLGYGGGKLIGEIAGTAGTGGMLARGLAAVPGLARAAPGLLDAVGSSGFTAGGLAGKTGLAARAAGGGLTGGAAAGLVNPEDAGLGAAVGAGMPGALQAVGKVGAATGRLLRGPEQSPELAAAIRSAQESGYVIPPTQAKASLGNRLLEGMAGKLTTAQNASAANQPVTNRLAAQALGLSPDVPITRDTLNQVRDRAGGIYRQLKTLGDMTSDARFANQIAGLKGAYEGAAKDFPGLAKPELSATLDSLKSPTFKASSAIDAVRLLRDEADKAFRGGDKGSAKALRAASSAMEDLIERNLLRINANKSLSQILRAGGGTDDIVAAGLTNNANQMLQDFRAARQLIAKTYTVEKALNPATGTIDAQKLAAELNKGKPLSGDLKKAADFGLQFKTASKTPEQMGSLPQLSPLDWAVGGSTAALSANPLGLLGVLARPAARKAALSPIVQRNLIQSKPGGLLGSQMDDLSRLGLLSAPILAGDL